LTFNSNETHPYELAGLIQAHTKPADLVVILDDGDPTVLYLAKRRGWHGFIEPNLGQHLNLEWKEAQGAQYFAGEFISCRASSEITCEELNEIVNRYTIVFKNENFFIVSLSTVVGWTRIGF
jgi:hypothetical protein